MSMSPATLTRRGVDLAGLDVPVLDIAGSGTARG